MSLITKEKLIVGIIIDLLFISIALVFLWIGLKKGFLKSIIGLIIMIISVIVSYIFSPILAETYFNKFIYNDLVNKINNLLNSGDVLKDIVNGKLFLLNSLPQFVLEDILKTINGKGDRAAEIAVILKPMIIDVVTLVMFSIILLVTFFALSVISKFLLKLPRLPLIGFMDSILGLGVGALKFLIFTFIFIVIYNAMFILIPGKNIVKEINKGIDESIVFKQVYNINENIIKNYLITH